MQWPMQWDTLSCGQFFLSVFLSVFFKIPLSCLSVLTDITDGIKKWKRHALSAKNYLIMKNENKIKKIGQVVFAVLSAPEFCYGWKVGQMTSNTTVANRQ